MIPRGHLWRLLRTGWKHRLLDVLTIEPFASVPKPAWLRLVITAGAQKAAPADVGDRLRLALIELGPVYIKLGQLLSTRRDLIPPAMADALAALQDDVPSFESDIALDILTRSLGRPISEVFAWVDPEPMAAASIAQVHAARLKSGEDVVVKIRRPGIESAIDETLEFLHALADTVERRSEAARRLRLAAVIDDYDHTIHAELDLACEARNTAQLRSNFAHSPLLYVPRPWLSLSSREVLVLERIHGIPVSDNDSLDAAGIDKALLADRGVRTFFKQVFVDNFFHADMHPGNVFVDIANPADPKYIALDCAIIGSLSEHDQDHLARSLLAFFNRDYAKVARIYVDSGWAPAGINVADFAHAIADACEPHFAKPLGEISFGAFLSDLFATAERFDIHMQPQLVLLQKTLLYVEGLGRSLYPQLDLWQTAKPFMETWVLERHGPRASLERLIRGIPALVESFAELPEWLPEARARLRAVESLQSAQSERLARLESAGAESHRRTRRQQRVATILLALGAILLIEPAFTGAFTGQAASSSLQTAAGVTGSFAGLTLLLRTLI